MKKQIIIILVLMFLDISFGSNPIIIRNSYRLDLHETENDSVFLAIGHDYNYSNQNRTLSKDSIWVGKVDIHGKVLYKKSFDKLDHSSYILSNRWIKIAEMVSEEDGYILSYNKGTIIKFNKTFEEVWRLKTNDILPWSHWDLMNFIIKVENGYVFANNISDKENNRTFVISKCDKNGRIKWRKNFGADLNVGGIVEESDNEINILVYEFSHGWIDKNEDIESFQNLKSAGSALNEKDNPLNTKEKNRSDFYVMKLDSSGNQLSTKKFPIGYSKNFATMKNFNNNLMILGLVGYKKGKLNYNSVSLFKGNEKDDYVVFSDSNCKYQNYEQFEINGSGFWTIINQYLLIKFDMNFKEIKKISIQSVFEKNNIPFYYSIYNEYMKKEDKREDHDYKIKYISNDKMLYWKLGYDEKIIVKLIDLSGL